MALVNMLWRPLVTRLVSLLLMGLMMAADISSGSDPDRGGIRWKRETEDPELGTRPCHCLYYYLSPPLIKHTFSGDMTTYCQYNFIYADKLSPFSSSYESKIGNASIPRINNRRRWLATDRACARTVPGGDPRSSGPGHHHPLRYRHVLEDHQDLQGGVCPH